MEDRQQSRDREGVVITAGGAPSAGTRRRSAGFQTCRIADFQIGKSYDVVRPAGLETRDWFVRSRSLSPSGLAIALPRQSLSRLPKPLKSADLEVCATVSTCGNAALSHFPSFIFHLRSAFSFPPRVTAITLT